VNLNRKHTSPYRVALVLTAVLLMSVRGFAGSQAERSPETQSAEARGGQVAGRETSSASYPLETADEAGGTVRVQSRPQRIISLTSFTDDILVDLVDHRRLVGLTSFSDDPTVSNVAGKISDIQNRLTVNLEVILSLQPDLVFVADWTEVDKVTQLRDAGVPVYVVATGLTVPAIQEKIRTIGVLVDARRQAQAMIERMDRRLAAVEAAVSSIPEGRRLTVMDYATWGSSQGSGSSWDEVIRLAGLINAVGGFASDQWGQVPLSKEKILELDPDMLILPGWVYGDPGEAHAFFKQMLEDPALQGLSSVREGRVYQIPEGLKAATSQYIVDAVEYLARLAYPMAFPE
jgi:iron complex transport system substrate-binding protein